MLLCITWLVKAFESSSMSLACRKWVGHRESVTSQAGSLPFISVVPYWWLLLLISSASSVSIHNSKCVNYNWHLSYYNYYYYSLTINDICIVSYNNCFLFVISGIRCCWRLASSPFLLPRWALACTGAGFTGMTAFHSGLSSGFSSG